MFNVISNIIMEIRGENQPIELGSSLRNDIGLTSLDMMMLIAQLENEYNINLSTEHFANIETVADLVSIVERTKDS